MYILLNISDKNVFPIINIQDINTISPIKNESNYIHNIILNNNISSLPEIYNLKSSHYNQKIILLYKEILYTLLFLIHILRTCTVCDIPIYADDGTTLLKQEALLETGKIDIKNLHIKGKAKPILKSPASMIESIIQSICHLSHLNDDNYWRTYLGIAGALQLCLTQTFINLDNPLSREWSILTIKNLLKDNQCMLFYIF